MVGAEDEELSFGDESIGSGVEIDGEDTGFPAWCVEEVGLGELVEDVPAFHGFGEEEIAHEPRASFLEVPGEEGRIGRSGDACIDFANADVDVAIIVKGEMEVGAAGAPITLGMKPEGGEFGLSEEFLADGGFEWGLGRSDVAFVDAVDAEDLVGEVVEVDGLLGDQELDAGRSDLGDVVEGVIDPALDEARSIEEVVGGDGGRVVGIGADEADTGGADGGLDDDVVVALFCEGGTSRGDAVGVGGIDGIEDRFSVFLEEVVEEVLVVSPVAAIDRAGQWCVGGFGEVGEAFVSDESVDEASG